MLWQQTCSTDKLLSCLLRMRWTSTYPGWTGRERMHWGLYSDPQALLFLTLVCTAHSRKESEVHLQWAGWCKTNSTAYQIRIEGGNGNVVNKERFRQFECEDTKNGCFCRLPAATAPEASQRRPVPRPVVPTYSLVSEKLRRVSSGSLQCALFCGGPRCKYYTRWRIDGRRKRRLWRVCSRTG